MSCIAEYQVVVEVLDKRFRLDDFTVEHIPQELYQWELGGITDPLGQLIGWLWDQISGALDVLRQSLEGFFRTIIDGLWNSISGAFSSLQSFFKGLFDTLSKSISSFVNQVLAAFEFVKSAFSSFQQAFQSFTQSIAATLAGISQAVTTLGTTIVKTFWDSVNALKEWFANAFTAIAQSLTTIYQYLTTFGRTVVEALQGYVDAFLAGVEDLLNKLKDTIGGFLDQLTDFLADIYNKLAKGVMEVQVTLMGFVNTLGKIYEWLVKLPETLAPILAETVAKLPSVAWEGMKWLGERVVGLAEWLFENVVVPSVKALMDLSRKAEEQLKGVLESIFNQFTSVYYSGIASLFEYTKEILSPHSPKGALAEVVSHAAKALPTAMAMGAVANMAADIAETEVQVAGSKVKLRTRWLHELARNLMLAGVFAAAGPAFGLTSRLGELALRREASEFGWVEIPTVHECIELLNRTVIDQNTLSWMVTSRGYHKSFVDMVLNEKGVTIDTRATKMYGDYIKDKTFVKFGLRWEMPTVSDLCRFMLKDVFLEAKDFVEIMKLRGVPEHLAYAYYLLHFKYPSMEKLWDFYCRVLAHEHLQARGTTIKEMLWLLTKEGKVPKSDDVAKALHAYAKWQDYSPISWFKGQGEYGTMQRVSDNDIMREMMADIPMRIDARWMYKWSIITDQELLGIVIARGMNPKWWETVAIAECMNALAEERTLARTGPITAYKEGYITLDALQRTLSNLTKVKILGKDVPVKFLEGEVKLLVLRAKYDRVIDIMRDYVRELVRSYADNIIGYDYVKNSVKEALNKFKDALGINLEFDANYWNAYQPVAEKLHEIYLVHRLRTWTRYMLYRIMWRFAEGYVSEEELNRVVDELAEMAKLTEQEKEFIKDMAKFMLDGFIKQQFAHAILRRVSRGVLKPEKAVEELQKLGLSKDVATAMVERYAKIYTLSPATYASMMEYIPIPDQLFVEKMAMVGMPEDEIKLYRAYAFARMISSEVGRYVTELISDYAEGLIDEQTLRRELEKVATLDGKVKQWFGVDWVVLHPLEREFFIALAKMRRQRYEARRRRRGG